MPVFIGDYLADTMHLSTEQHGAYLLLLFHLWRRGTLLDDDGVLAQITGLSKDAWSHARPVLAEFFEIHEGLWRHGRVERERTRIAAKQQSNTNRLSLADQRIIQFERRGAQQRQHDNQHPRRIPCSRK